MPSAQGVAEVAPVTATNDPGGAFKHEICPLDGWKVPSAHGVAEIAPVTATNDPGGAGVHGWLPVEEKEPGAQGVLARAGVAPAANPTARAKPTITLTRVISARRRAAPNLTFALHGTISLPFRSAAPLASRAAQGPSHPNDGATAIAGNLRDA